MFTVYIKSEVNLPASVRFIMDKVTHADGKCWEIRSVTKMEWNPYAGGMDFFVLVNGTEKEFSLYGMSASDVFAVYPE